MVFCPEYILVRIFVKSIYNASEVFFSYFLGLRIVASDHNIYVTDITLLFSCTELSYCATRPFKFMSFFSDPDDPYKLSEDTRALGLTVCRGTSVVLICPQDGLEEIPNPFVQHG